MKKIIIFLVVVLLVAIAYFMFMGKTTNAPTNQPVSYAGEIFTFANDEGHFTVQYNADGDKALVKINDSQYDLNSAISGSGAKYESADGKVVFWEHQGDGLLEVDGQTLVPGAKLVADTPDQDGLSSSTEATMSPAERALAAHPWLWRETTYTASDPIAPIEPEAFRLTFMDENRFSATTDCNDVMGNYEVGDGTLALTQMASTKMACPDKTTQEEAFTAMLASTTGYALEVDGTLALTLSDKAGIMVFIPLMEDITG